MLDCLCDYAEASNAMENDMAKKQSTRVQFEAPTVESLTDGIRRRSLECIDHPEWGTWGIMDRTDYNGATWFDIGGRTLSPSEAATHWRFVS